MGALIELKNIGYSYHNLAGETGAIKDVSFQVEEGEFVALVGPSELSGGMKQRGLPAAAGTY